MCVDSGVCVCGRLPADSSVLEISWVVPWNPLSPDGLLGRFNSFSPPFFLWNIISLQTQWELCPFFRDCCCVRCFISRQFKSFCNLMRPFFLWEPREGFNLPVEHICVCSSEGGVVLWMCRGVSDCGCWCDCSAVGRPSFRKRNCRLK